MACHRDPGLGEMYAIVRSEALLAGRLAALTHQVCSMALCLLIVKEPVNKLSCFVACTSV